MKSVFCTWWCLCTVIVCILLDTYVFYVCLWRFFTYLLSANGWVTNENKREKWKRSYCLGLSYSATWVKSSYPNLHVDNSVPFSSWGIAQPTKNSDNLTGMGWILFWHFWPYSCCLFVRPITRPRKLLQAPNLARPVHQSPLYRHGLDFILRFLAIFVLPFCPAHNSAQEAPTSPKLGLACSSESPLQAWFGFYFEISGHICVAFLSGP